MSIRPVLLALGFLVFVAATQEAATQPAEPNVLAPYRFQPPPPALSPLEQQKALSYRSQLQNQMRQLDQQRTLGGPHAVDPTRLMDTRRELDRMDRTIRP